MENTNEDKILEYSEDGQKKRYGFVSNLLQWDRKPVNAVSSQQNTDEQQGPQTCHRMDAAKKHDFKLFLHTHRHLLLSK